MGALLVATTVEGIVVGIAAGLGYRLLLSEWSIPLGYLLAHVVMLRSVERKGWDYVHLDLPAARPPKLVYGALLGLGAIAVPSLMLLGFGQLRSVPAPDGSWWVATGISFANLLPSAFGEELFLRGYIFSVLREAVGARWTLISTSIAFGLLHIPNPGADGQSILIVILAGFFLGSILLATRSLYAATAAHFAWNWFMAAGLHTPVSGLPVISPDYRVIDAGPDWLTGGGWGPEGGLAAALGMFAVLIYLHARPLRRMES
ncbi:MAG TPA: type II CAAX endopeptidase family protein [Gemmatimonadaceae bacterium]|nr:type II CAAX endopeptidase family protein [Gemmatimonadaceae bacterium]